MEIEILALELLRAHVRMSVNEFGSWSNMERLFKKDGLVNKACAMLGVTLESIRNAYYLETFEQTYDEAEA